MPRIANDGRGRLGGRVKGTPNKKPLPLREWATAQIDKNRGRVEKLLLDPDAEGVAVLYAALALVANSEQAQAGTDENNA